MKAIFVVSILINLCIVCLCEQKYYYRNDQRSQYNNAYGTNRNNLEWSGYSYTLDEGHCSGTKVVDEDVKKDADPYTYKKTSFTWSGSELYTIKCVRVLNRMSRDENAAEVRITSGGVGQGNIRIEMRSQDSQRIHFHLEIWAEQTRKASNVAVMTGLPDKAFIFNGKRYCECS
ncbi:hypothetical protein ABEB36_005404 [Hypothenemus hampei]|uniref:Uncharacterized protein n=1 Tax=Hypothenemus hampei TaxID=57062 RepID=A0ABD1EY50_HYPHA